MFYAFKVHLHSKSIFLKPGSAILLHVCFVASIQYFYSKQISFIKGRERQEKISYAFELYLRSQSIFLGVEALSFSVYVSTIYSCCCRLIFLMTGRQGAPRKYVLCFVALTKYSVNLSKWGVAPSSSISALKVQYIFYFYSKLFSLWAGSTNLPHLCF